MNDPGVIKFLNEDLRPLAEACRAIKARSGSALIRWENVVQQIVPDEKDTAVIDDGRSKDGVNQIQVDQVHLLTKLLVATMSQIDDVLIERFCVRPLEVR